MGRQVRGVSARGDSARGVRGPGTVVGIGQQDRDTEPIGGKDGRERADDFLESADEDARPTRFADSRPDRLVEVRVGDGPAADRDGDRVGGAARPHRQRGTGPAVAEPRTARASIRPGYDRCTCFVTTAATSALSTSPGRNANPLVTAAPSPTATRDTRRRTR